MAASIELYLLGSGTILSRGEQACSSIFIRKKNTTILVDCRIGSFMRLKKLGIPPTEIDFIFMTHFHPDHMADLVPLLFYLANSPVPLTKTLHLWGPPGLIQLVSTFHTIYGEWLETPAYLVHELSASPIITDAFILEWKKVLHSKQAVGYRFNFQGKIISVSGDSGYCPALVDLCASADLAILECSFPDELEKTGHLTPGLVAKIADQAQVKQLIITHLYPENHPQTALAIIQKFYSGPVTVGNDLAHFIL